MPIARSPDVLRYLILLATNVCLTPLASAQSDVKSALATRTSGEIRIDANLNEPEWQLAQAVTDFVQFSPLEGTSPTQRTEVRIMYDDDALYVGATMYDTEAAGIVARLARRDEEIDCDWFSIRFDSYHDHQTAYEFTVTASGNKIDILQYDDGDREDVSWDAVWKVETSILSDRWVAEYRIPFSMLRFQDQDLQEWGLQMVRAISRNQENLQWQLVPRAVNGWVSRFGHLRGIQGVESRQTVELLPYLVGENNRQAPNQGRLRSVSSTADVGIDVKYRPSANLTVDATLNPDFGQVEADPAVLNLSTFETFYPERRPFFVEGIQILRFTSFGDGTGPGLFYSRRIGRSLSASAPAGGYVLEDPGFATIVGAAKISGKTSSGLSIGLLEAVTAEESATVVDSNGARFNKLLEPSANYSVLRLKQDFGNNSNAGLILTGLWREDRIPAIVGGTDWNVRLLDNMYKVDGFFAHTRTEARGFLEEGSAGKAGFSKVGGEHWRGGLSYDFTSKAYNVNDVGFFRRPNDHGFLGNVLYRDDRVDEWKRIYNISLNYHRRLNFDGAELINQYELSGYLMLVNYWEIDAEVSINTAKHDDRETRGLGLFRKPSTKQFDFNIETDPRSSVVLDLSYGVQVDSRRGLVHDVGIESEIKPSPAITLEISVGLEYENDLFTWVDNTEDASVAPGEFSVFGERTTRAWDLTSRSSYVIARDLTLQWYAQLFVAKGYYENEMRRTGEDSYVPYAYPSEDFTESSFLSTLVLRWEYFPGSTLYAVWSHSRSGEIPRYIRPLGTNIGDTFRRFPDNVFLLKVSYWLSS